MLWRIAGPLALIAVLTACGATDPPRGFAQYSGPSGPSSEHLDLTPTPSRSVRPMTVTGTVSAGVESGCLLFTPNPPAGGGVWVLVGRTAGVKPGTTVTITGSLAPDLVTTCQQGTPFRVDAVVSD